MAKLELKPCPFCGCKMEVVPMAKTWLHRGVGSHHPDCYLRGVPVRVDKTWNNREFDWSKAENATLHN